MTDGTNLGPCVLVYEPSGPFGILSNFAPTPIEINGEVWPTTEHYFQSQKFLLPEDRERLRRCRTAESCKRLAWGELYDAIRPNWDNLRTKVMRAALEAKYAQSSNFRKTLNATWPMPIIENSPEDDFWGVGARGTGANMLGRILTEIRNINVRLPEIYSPNQEAMPAGNGGHSVGAWLPILQVDGDIVGPMRAAFRSLKNSKISGRLRNISLDRQMHSTVLSFLEASNKDLEIDGNDGGFDTLETWISQLANEPAVHDKPFAKYLFDEVRPMIMDMKYADYSLHEDARSVLPNWRLSLFGLLAKNVDGALYNQRVLAIGAGSANESGEIWSALGSRVTLVDIGSRLVENCKAGAPEARVLQAAAEDLSEIRSRSCDLYCSFRTYQSIFFDIHCAVAEAYRVLRPGGTAIVSVSNAYLSDDGSIIRGQIDSDAKLNLEKPWKDLITIGNTMRTQGFVNLRMEDLTTELVVIADRK